SQSEDEQIVIGTNASLLVSPEAEFLLSYHCYTRALHLFIRELQIRIERLWDSFEAIEQMIQELEESLFGKKLRKKLAEAILGSNLGPALRKSRSATIIGVRTIEQLFLLIKITRDSLESTDKKYRKKRAKRAEEMGKGYYNKFHIRKTVSILDERVESLELILLSLQSKGHRLLEQLELYSSEMVVEAERRIEIIGIVLAVIGTVLAILGFQLL
ncbi:MAG: hypothetical protein ACFFB3_21525, partial [Candidatus Hodarchaeota archaeon]